MIREEAPISFIVFGLRCNPTINKRKAIPNLEKTLIISVDTPNLIINGLITIPAII